MNLVVDASVAINWFIDEPGHIQALEMTVAESRLFAPDIVLAEVAHVLRRKVRMQLISNVQAREAVTTLSRKFANLVAISDVIKLAYDLSAQLDHSIYDSIYLACALQETDRVLVTADVKFATKASNAGYADKIRILASLESGTELGQENGNG